MYLFTCIISFSFYELEDSVVTSSVEKRWTKLNDDGTITSYVGGGGGGADSNLLSVKSEILSVLKKSMVGDGFYSVDELSKKP